MAVGSTLIVFYFPYQFCPWGGNSKELQRRFEV
jgi:hypothetical protein